MPTTRTAFVLTALLIAAPALAADPEPLFQFNGKDLTGFYTYLHDHKYEDPDGVFKVVDGEIRVSGAELGGFITKDEYENYHLITEWKFTGETHAPREKASRDSGLLVHCTGPDDAWGGHWMQSMEANIIEGGAGDFIVVSTKAQGGKDLRLSSHVRKGDDGQWYFTPDGSGELREFDSGRINWFDRDPEWKDVAGFVGKNDVQKPVGEWNLMEMICDGDSITVKVNGKVVNVGLKSTVTKGKITFQSEYAGIAFRRIEILPLPAK